MDEYDDDASVNALVGGQYKEGRHRSRSHKGLRCCGLQWQCFTGDRMGKLLCAIMVIVAIIAVVMVGFAIAIVAMLPSINQAGMAPVEMNERMKLAEKQGRDYLSQLAPKYPSNQVEVTLTQALDTIDNAHAISSKLNGAITEVDTKVMARGIESAFRLLDKADRAIGTEEDVNSAQIGANIKRITARIADYMDATAPEKMNELTDGVGGVLGETKRLMQGVDSARWNNMIDKVHSIVSQVEADKLFDHASQFMEVVSKIATKMDSEDGLTIKL